MPDTPARLAEKLLAEGEKTLQFFRSLTPEQWRLTLYDPEGNGAEPQPERAPEIWDLCDLLAHFVSAEASFGLLVRNILAGGDGAPQDFDIDRYNRSKVSRLRGSSPTALLDELQALRRQNVELVKGLQEADLSRKGRHPFLGIAPLADILKLIYRHQAIHLRDVRNLALN